MSSYKYTPFVANTELESEISNSKGNIDNYASLKAMLKEDKENQDKLEKEKKKIDYDDDLNDIDRELKELEELLGK